MEKSGDTKKDVINSNRSVWIFVLFVLLANFLKHGFNPYTFEEGSWQFVLGEFSQILLYVLFVIAVAVLLSAYGIKNPTIFIVCITFSLLMAVEMFFMFRINFFGIPEEKKISEEVAAIQQKKIPEIQSTRYPDTSSFHAEKESRDDLIEHKPIPEHSVKPIQGELSFSATYKPHRFTDLNREFGFMNRLSDTITSEVTVNDRESYEVTYVHDSFGRRRSGISASGRAEKYAIFLGCSATYGIHVKSDQTLPAQFEKLNPEYKSYNYGINGSAPNHYLAMLQNLDLRSQIPKEDGICIYPFFEDHVRRVIGDYQSNAWNNGTPYYYLDHGELKRCSNFDECRPLISLMFRIFRNSYFIKYIRFNYPKETTEEHYELLIAIIDQMRIEYKKQFNSDQFFVFLLPGFETGLIPYLEEKNIPYINGLKCIPEYWNGYYTFPIDNHPNGKAYHIMAEEITRALKNRGVIEG